MNGKETEELTGISRRNLRFYEDQGLNKKEIIKRIAKDRNVNKNEIYQHFI